MNSVIKQIFDVSDSIRYVAIYKGDDLEIAQKEGVADSSKSETDKYEELLVNPTLLKLAEQRGNIDCGGLNYLIIRYGNFFQLVVSIEDGHISICVDKNANPIEIEKLIRDNHSQLFECI